MKNFIKKINDTIGLTKSESIVFWFLIIAFAFGIIVKLVYGDVVKVGASKYDYSVFDKEFEKRSAEIEKFVSIRSDTLPESSGERSAELSVSSFKVNINTATKEELMKIPGVGSKTAEQIIKHRETYGKFERIEDIMNVKGIGQKKFEKMKNYLTTN
ncbi:MAG: ComEA family DNA-binding protein [Candidatus Kryptonium sp.]